LLWDSFGKIVDCVVNPPGSFHDSRSCMYGNIYRHVKEYVEGLVASDRDATLTHLRQASEWGNNVLTGVFRRLKNELPTDNVHRATILWTAVLLHNFRTETMDRNQIKTYFNEVVKKYND